MPPGRATFQYATRAGLEPLQILRANGHGYDAVMLRTEFRLG